ncbi:MAG TPA: hypothetical protein VGF99_06485, partial [Myxococcota bacterium]
MQHRIRIALATALFIAGTAIRRSPDGTHLALGTPPLAVDLDTSLVEAAPGAWATTWAEVYVV